MLAPATLPLAPALTRPSPTAVPAVTATPARRVILVRRTPARAVTQRPAQLPTSVTLPAPVIQPLAPAPTRPRPTAAPATMATPAHRRILARLVAARAAIQWSALPPICAMSPAPASRAVGYALTRPSQVAVS